MGTDDLRLRAMMPEDFLTWIAELRHNVEILAGARV